MIDLEPDQKHRAMWTLAHSHRYLMDRAYLEGNNSMSIMLSQVLGMAGFKIDANGNLKWNETDVRSFPDPPAGE